MIESTPLTGLLSVDRRRIGDERGYLERLFCDEDLRFAGFDQPIRQINRTLTRQATSIRGLHFQYPPYAETKFVSCLRGTVFDVAVDLRRSSTTFLEWHGEILSDENARSLFIPEGFAHGFQTLTNDVEMLYLHTECYQPAAEEALNALDPSIAIAWPLEPGPMSGRDRRHPLIAPDFTGIEL